MPIQIVYFSRPFSLKKLLRDSKTGKIFLCERSSPVPR